MRDMQDYPARKHMIKNNDSLGYHIFDDMGRQC